MRTILVSAQVVPVLNERKIQIDNKRTVSTDKVIEDYGISS